jgi:hypothetical protein
MPSVALHVVEFSLSCGFDSFRTHDIFNHLLTKSPHGSTFDEVLKKPDLAHMGSKRTAHLSFSYLIGAAEGLVSKGFISNSAIIVYRHRTKG